MIVNAKMINDPINDFFYIGTVIDEFYFELIDKKDKIELIVYNNNTQKEIDKKEWNKKEWQERLNR
jgi:hypothetical protein